MSSINEDSAKSQPPRGLSFRRQAIGIIVLLLGLGAFLGAAGGLAATEEISDLPSLSDELRFWPVAMLCCVFIAVAGYKMGGIKGLALSILVPGLMWVIGLLILGVVMPAFVQLVHWVADGSSKSSHAILGALLGMLVVLPVIGVSTVLSLETRKTVAVHIVVNASRDQLSESSQRIILSHLNLAPAAAKTSHEQ